MIKALWMYKRVLGLSVEEFRRESEEYARQVGSIARGRARRYLRRYLDPGFDGEDVSTHPIDVISEMWFDDEASYRSVASTLTHDEPAVAIAARVFDATKTVHAMVDEVERMPEPRETSRTIKQIELLSRLPGTSPEEFRRRYAQYAAPIAQWNGSRCSSYRQRFLVPPPGVSGLPDYPFDVITEMWWESREDWQACLEKYSDPKFLEIYHAYWLVYDADNAYGAIAYEHETDLASGSRSSEAPPSTSG